MTDETPIAAEREAARALDAADPLAGFRSRFSIPDGCIYLDGNSLGPMPAGARALATRLIEKEWGDGLIASWNDAGWFQLPGRLGDKLAPLIGADAGEVVLCDSTSINLFKLLSAAVQLRPERSVLILEGSNFPTNTYMAEGLALLSGGRLEVRLCEGADILRAIDDRTAAVAITHAHYKTGHVHDMAAITAAAHAAGALAIFDLCHTAGAMPVALNGCGADFAVGCTYKYLNGGPGSPAFLFAAARHHGAVQQPLTGWWGHADPFDFDRHYRPAPGIAQYLSGTQPILSLAMAELGLDIARDADLHAVRAKSVALTEQFIRLVESRCAGHGFGLASPRDSAVRGSQVSLTHSQGFAIMQALIDRGVVGDFRAPDILRFGFAPLYVRHVDVLNAVEVLADIMQTGAWQSPEYQVRRAVT
jgi:kynureninase